MQKDFILWHNVKEQLDKDNKPPLFKQREIWWCSIGVNIGHESDGKSQYFTRPVLIVRKFNRQIFLGVPLTTKIKENPFYFPIELHNKKQCVMIAQSRVWDASRLKSRMGWLTKSQFEQVRQKLRGII